MDTLAFPEIVAPAAPPAAAASAVAAPVATQAQPAAQTVTVKQAVLALFAPLESDLRQLSEKYRAVAFDMKTSKGMNEAKEARNDLRKHGRYAIQRLRDQSKDAMNDAKKAAEAEAERLIAIVKPREDEIDALIKAREDEIEAARQVEIARKQAHQSAIAKIQGYLTEARSRQLTAQRLADGVAYVEALDVSAAQFEEFAEQAAQARETVLVGLRDLYARAVAEEQQRAEAERQRVENERMAAALAEQQRQLAEQAAALDRKRAELEAARCQQETKSVAVAAETRPAVAACPDASAVIDAREAENPAPSREAAPQSPAAFVASVVDQVLPSSQQASIYRMGRDTVSDTDYRIDWPKDADETSIETSEAEAREIPIPVLQQPAAALAGQDLQPLLADALALVQHALQAFEGRFPSHPKPEQSWWADLRAQAERLLPQLAAATAEVRA
jgi:hypothetical protein